MHAAAFNRTDRPVIIDDEGRVLAGREWGVVDTTADPVKSAAERGDIEVLRGAEESSEQAPDAAAAIREAAELEDQRKTKSQPAEPETSTTSTTSDEAESRSRGRGRSKES